MDQSLADLGHERLARASDGSALPQTCEGSAREAFDPLL
jgi:hypothetical protein